MPIGQSIAATAAEEVARKDTIAAGGETSNDKETELSVCTPEIGHINSAGLDAVGFIRVCLQLMRDNFLVKVGAVLCGMAMPIIPTIRPVRSLFTLSFYDKHGARTAWRALRRHSEGDDEK